jgi:hypothetical protein
MVAVLLNEDHLEIIYQAPSRAQVNAYHDVVNTSPVSMMHSDRPPEPSRPAPITADAMDPTAPSEPPQNVFQPNPLFSSSND